MSLEKENDNELHIESLEKRSEGSNSDFERLVVPVFMGKPSEWTLSRTGKKVHQYNMPEDGSEIIEAIQWMMTVYDNVESEYGESYGCPYCYLVGTVRKA